jgi:hypothetical protein
MRAKASVQGRYDYDFDCGIQMTGSLELADNAISPAVVYVQSWSRTGGLKLASGARDYEQALHRKFNGQVVIFGCGKRATRVRLCILIQIRAIVSVRKTSNAYGFANIIIQGQLKSVFLALLEFTYIPLVTELYVRKPIEVWSEGVVRGHE